MLASLIASVVSGQTEAVVNRTRRALVAYILAALAVTCGLGFLLAALYIWLAARYGSIEAALGMGVAFMIVAGLIVVGHRVAATVRARRAAERRKADLSAVGVATAVALLPALLRSKAGLGVLLGPAVALAIYAIYRENSKPVDPED